MAGGGVYERRQRERNVRPRAGFLRSENPLYRVSSLWLRLRPPLLQYLLCSSLHGPFSHGLPGLDYRFSTPPFPPLVPLDVLPFTTTSFPPLCSSPSCCLPVYLPIDPQGPSPKASCPAWLCIPSRSSCSGGIPNVNITASVQDDAAHGRLWQTIVVTSPLVILSLPFNSSPVSH